MADNLFCIYFIWTNDSNLSHLIFVACTNKENILIYGMYKFCLNHHSVFYIHLGQTRTFLNSKTNSRMTGKPLKVVPYGCYSDAMVVEVSGRGHYTGECSFWVEQGDELGAGFLIK